MSDAEKQHLPNLPRFGCVKALLNTSLCWGIVAEYLLWILIHNCASSHPQHSCPRPSPPLPLTRILFSLLLRRLSPYLCNASFSVTQSLSSLVSSEKITTIFWALGPMDTHTHFACTVSSLQHNNTPLHRAADYGRTAVCELLITKGANVNAVDSEWLCDGEWGREGEGRGGLC